MQSTYASIPLIDGMIIPLNILSFFVRQSVNNLSRRKRLEDSQRYFFFKKKKQTALNDCLL
jgi:hypothetical protein